MNLFLLLRFHLVPALASLVEAARRGPLVFGIAGFLAATLVGLTLAGKPVLTLPADPGLAALTLVGLTSGLAGALWTAGLAGVRRWRSFFLAKPGGPLAWRVFLGGRALGVWLAAAVTVSGLSGPGIAALAAVAGCALPFTLTALLGWGSSGLREGRSRARRLAWLPAWWLSRPFLFVVPLAAWLGLMGWATSGQAGFAWTDRPPVVGLLLDFGWPTVFGLLWSEAASQVPYSYFRMARAPFRRVLAVVGLPVAAATFVVLLVEAAVGWGGGHGIRTAVLTAAGTAFWFTVWLRWGPATLAHLMLFVTLFLVGVAAQRDWWVLWAVLQTGAAAAALAGWRTQYYEGEVHAGS